MSLTVSGSSAASVAGAPAEVSTVSGLSSVDESQQRYMDEYHAETLVGSERVALDRDVEGILWENTEQRQKYRTIYHEYPNSKVPAAHQT